MGPPQNRKLSTNRLFRYQGVLVKLIYCLQLQPQGTFDVSISAGHKPSTINIIAVKGSWARTYDTNPGVALSASRTIHPSSGIVVQATISEIVYQNITPYQRGRLEITKMVEEQSTPCFLSIFSMGYYLANSLIKYFTSVNGSTTKSKIVN